MPVLQPPGPDVRPSEQTYVDGYNSIVSRVRRKGGGSAVGVVVFVGVDVDGLLASRILASLFSQDDIPYRLVPINGYSELEEKADEVLRGDADIHTLILLSLGSLLDLASFFNLPRGCQLHIIDARRPWNLDNLFGIEFDEDEDGQAIGEEKIWVWGDGTEVQLSNVKKSWEALEYEPEDEDSGSETEEDETDGEDDGEDEDGEGENGEGSEQNGKKRRRADSSKPKKRRREDGDDVPRRLPREVRRAHRERIDKYYESGTSYGLSVTETVYLLATVLERADNDLLWFAILALTHQYVAAHTDRDEYESRQNMLNDEVARLNSAAEVGPNPDNRSISTCDELRFVLYRHWNLYDAMLHSDYVASRLGVWKEKGRRRLQQLLAKMGFSLLQCQQEYAHMDMGLKRDLPVRLDDVGPEYALVELIYPSFLRAFGFQLSNLSAADAVEALEALLEAAKGIRIEVEVPGGRGGGEWFGGTRTWTVGDESCLLPGDKELTTVGEAKEDPLWHVHNFWIAYDACSDVALLRKSLQLAKSLHRAILRQGTAILDKTVIRRLRTFRFAAISEGPDLKLFCNPAPLGRLALWLVNATRERWVERDEKEGNRTVSLPFVIACLNEDTKTYVVVGVTGAPEFGDVRKNKFALAFQRAAGEANVSYMQDTFDTAVIEIGADDLKGFIEMLQLLSV